MRVLLVSLNYWPEPTGIAPYSTKLAEGLVAKGHEVIVLTGVPHYPQWRNYTSTTTFRTTEWIGSVRVTRLRHYIPPGGTGLKRALLEVSFAAALSFCRWPRADVVVCVSPSLLGSSLTLLRERLRPDGAPVIIWAQDLYSRGVTELRDGRGWLATAVRELESVTLRHADCVVVIHEVFMRIVSESLGVENRRVAEIRNWSHLGKVASEAAALDFRRRYGWHDRPIVLHCGNMGAKQGLRSVVGAARQAEQEGSRVLFVLLGDGAQRQQLLNEAEGCSNIVWIPPLPDAEFRAALRAADILLLNEQVGVREMALPSKLTTYFSVAKPIVAAVDSEGISAEEMRRARAGLIVEAGNKEQLLRAIDRLLNDAALARQFGAAGKAYTEEHLTEELVISKWDELIRELGQRTRMATTSDESSALNRQSLGGGPR